MGDQARSSNLTTANEAAKRTGLGSRNTARDAKATVAKGSPELVAAMDAGEVAPSVAAKVAELPKAEQKKVVKGGKAAIKKALAPPKPKHEYPLSDQFLHWLESITAQMTVFKQNHSEIAKMIGNKQWDSKQTKHIAAMLKGVAKTVTQFNKEMESCQK